jgi:hypothetical protein
VEDGDRVRAGDLVRVDRARDRRHAVDLRHVMSRRRRARG